RRLTMTACSRSGATPISISRDRAQFGSQFGFGACGVVFGGPDELSQRGRRRIAAPEQLKTELAAGIEWPSDEPGVQSVGRRCQGESLAVGHGCKQRRSGAAAPQRRG